MPAAPEERVQEVETGFEVESPQALRLGSVICNLRITNYKLRMAELARQKSLHLSRDFRGFRLLRPNVPVSRPTRFRHTFAAEEMQRTEYQLKAEAQKRQTIADREWVVTRADAQSRIRLLSCLPNESERHSAESADEDTPVAGYNEALAHHILSALEEVFPKKLSSDEIKTKERALADVPEE